MPSAFTPGVKIVGVPGPPGPEGPPGEGGGGPHTHPEYEHTHPYAPDPHTHAEFTHTHDYAASNHTHAYAPVVHTHDYAATGHTHTAADVGASPSGHDHNAAYSSISHTHDYAATTHNHDGVYAPTHSHPYADVSHGTHVDMGEAADISTQAFGDAPAAGASTTEVAAADHKHGMPANPVTAHEAAADPHTGYVREADVNWVDLTDGGQTALHSHAGGGSATWNIIQATADQSNNTNTLADDSALQITLAANTNYTLRIRAVYLTNATADLAYRLVFAGTTTRLRRRVVRTATTDTAQTIELKTAFDSADVVLSTTGLNPWFEEDIYLQVGATGGIMKVQFKQVTANAGPTTRLQGSYLEHRVVA